MEQAVRGAAHAPRRGAACVRVTVALCVAATDVAGALAIAWDAFLSAARGCPGRLGIGRRRSADPAGAAINLRQRSHGPALSVACLRARRQRARDEVALQVHPGGEGEHVAAFLPGDGDRVLGEGVGRFRDGRDAAGLSDNSQVTRRSSRSGPDTQVPGPFPRQAPRRVLPERVINEQLAKRRKVIRGGGRQSFHR